MGFAFAIGKDSEKYFIQTQLQGLEAGRKIPTALLLDKDKQFKAFGKPAMEEYFDMEDDEMEDHFFFDRFKMVLGEDSV